jgi:hypothetical protein
MNNAAYSASAADDTTTGIIELMAQIEPFIRSGVPALDKYAIAPATD